MLTASGMDIGSPVWEAVTCLNCATALEAVVERISTERKSAWRNSPLRGDAAAAGEFNAALYAAIVNALPKERLA